MSQELICITCPIGCHLSVDRLEGGEIQVSGNRCPRGAAYAREEILSPKRVVTATCRIGRPAGPGPAGLSAPRRVPWRTTGPFPKERVLDLVALVSAMEIGLPVARGQVILSNALDTGVDVILTRSIS
jgi:CxxC motif-containing protein